MALQSSSVQWLIFSPGRNTRGLMYSFRILLTPQVSHYQGQNWKLLSKSGE